MIVEIQNLTEFDKKRRDYSPRYVRLLDQNKNVLIGYNQGIKNFDPHLKELETFFNSEDLPPGIYYFEVRRVMKNEGILYKITKQNINGAPLTLPQQMEPAKVKTLIVDDAELLQLKVDNERMIYQMRLMQEEINELNEYIEDLENADPVTLEDNAAPKWLDTLKDLLPAIADPVIGEWRRMNDIKQAQIGYNYEVLKQQGTQKQVVNQEINNNHEQKEIVTFEELEEFRTNVPNEFYNWYSQPGNGEYYETLKKEYESAI